MKTFEFEDKIKVTDGIPSTKAKPVRGIVSCYDKNGNLVFERENTITLAGRQYLYNLVAERMFKKNSDDDSYYVRNNNDKVSDYKKPTVKMAAKTEAGEKGIILKSEDLSKYSIRKIFFGGKKVETEGNLTSGAAVAEAKGVDFADVGLFLRAGDNDSIINGRLTTYRYGWTGTIGEIKGIIKPSGEEFVELAPEKSEHNLAKHKPLLYNLNIGENFFAENDTAADKTDTYIEAGITENELINADGYRYRLTIKVLNLGINLKSPDSYDDIINSDNSDLTSYYNNQGIRSLGLVLSPKDTLTDEEIHEDDIIFSYLDKFGDEKDTETSNDVFNIGGDNIYTIVYRVEF